MLITPDLLNALLVVVGAVVTWFLSRGKTPSIPGVPTSPPPSIPTWVPHVDPSKAKDIVPGDRPILEGLLAVVLHLVEEQRRKNETSPTPAPKETA